MSDRLRKVIHAFSAVADLGAEIADTRDFDEMVNASLQVVLGSLGVRRGAACEYDEGAGLLRYVATRGHVDEPTPDLPLPPEEADALLAGEGAAVSIEAGEGHAGAAAARPSPRTRFLARLREARVVMYVPLVVHARMEGVILLGEKASGEPYTSEERDVARALGRHIGVGLHNHRLLREIERRVEETQRIYEELRGIYDGTVRAFAAAIDSKDKYTQGHSERVGKYSEVIARELGWTPEEVEGMAIAGYLHDVGKLVVDRDIINAPYKIDAKQSSELNRHPAAGYEILSPIKHPYADIPLSARYHHERIDGRGYPEGLKGDEIPLCAKIVTLADSFDAMTTDRPYKRRREFADVVEDLRHNTGRQFAPEVVVAFCRALLKELEAEGVRQRPMLRLLGRDYIDAAQAAPLLAQLIAEIESGATAAVGGA
jgi:response regulator RpfG family c-di-GMP phosphodiesterase